MEIPKPNYSGVVFYPSHLIDPAEKGKDWCMQYIKAMYYQWYNSTMWTVRRNDWIENRKYADGNQSVQKYVDWYARVKNDQGQKTSMMNLDWSIVSTIPKIRRVVINYLLKLQYDITANAVNPEAISAKETAKMRMWAEKQLQPFLKQQEGAVGVALTNPETDMIPETKAELEILFNLTYKMAEELKIELATQHILDKNQWEITRRKCIEDLFDNGFAAVETITNPYTQELDCKYIDVVNLVYDNFRGKTGDKGDGDLDKLGYFELVSIAQLRQEAGDQLTPDDYVSIAASYAGKYNNPYAAINANMPYVNTDANYGQWESYKVPVFRLYWYSLDRQMIKKVDVNGEVSVYQKPFSTPPSATTIEENGVKVRKEVVPVDIETVYGATWVINTTFCYNAGKVYDISRDKSNPRECFMPIKLYRSDNKSILESIMPYADAMQLTWLRLQNLKTVALPKGVMIDIAAWENVMVDGKIKSTAELFQMALESGVILYRGVNTIDEGGSSQARPIQEFEGGLGKQFQELVADMDYNMRMVYEVSGINDIMAASNPNPNMLSGVVKQAVQSSENSLGTILSGLTYLHEKTAVDISLKLQLMLQNGTINVYSKALGKVVEIGSEVSPMTFGINIEARPTDKQKEEIRQMLMSSVINPNSPATGGLLPEDAIMLISEIDAGANLKMVIYKYGYLLKKRRDEFAQMEQQKIKTQSDGIVQQTQAAGAEQQKAMQMEFEMKKQLIWEQANADVFVMQNDSAERKGQDALKSELKKSQMAFQSMVEPNK